MTLSKEVVLVGMGVLVVFEERAGVADMVLVRISCVVFRRTSCVDDGPVAGETLI